MSRAFLKGRHVAVGVGEGIAAYKAGDFIRELRRAGAQVRVAMTPAAQEFVTPLLLQSLSGNAVLTDYFDTTQEAKFGHLHLSRWADVFVVIPATADLIARLRAGMANDAVTTPLSAFRGPVLLCPAMNTAMWDNARVQDNVKTLLQERRYRIVGPGVGPLADGDVGAGRLSELHELVDAVAALGEAGPLAGKKVLLTAGPTREHFDPVRFISNPSSGKMGLALAEVAKGRGAEVTVVLGPSSAPVPEGVEIVNVTSAEQMSAAVQARVAQCDVFIASAAVSDWRPERIEAHKVKKSSGPDQVTLVRTPDVLALASATVHAQPLRPVLVGFAAETRAVLESAKDKLERKKLDFIVANDVSVSGAGFEVDTNQVTILGANGTAKTAQGSKREVAAAIWDAIS